MPRRQATETLIERAGSRDACAIVQVLDKPLFWKSNYNNLGPRFRHSLIFHLCFLNAATTRARVHFGGATRLSCRSSLLFRRVHPDPLVPADSDKESSEKYRLAPTMPSARVRPPSPTQNNDHPAFTKEKMGASTATHSSRPAISATAPPPPQKACGVRRRSAPIRMPSLGPLRSRQATRASRSSRYSTFGQRASLQRALETQQHEQMVNALMIRMPIRRVANPINVTGASGLSLQDATTRRRSVVELCWEKFYLPPGSMPRRLIDALVLSCLLISLLVTPFRVGFKDHEWDGFASVLLYIVRVVFAVDLACGFFTGYRTPRGDEYESSHSKMAMHHLFSWLLPDLLAAFPLNLVSSLPRRWADLLLCLKVIKLNYLVRVLGTKRYLLSKEVRAFFGIIQLSLSVLLFAHWAACFFWHIELKELERSQLDSQSANFARYELASAVGVNFWMYDVNYNILTWLHINRFVDEYNNLMVDSPYLVATAASWNLLVGNTNNPMQTETERVYAAAVMLLGTVLTAYMVAQISVLMTVLNGSGREFSQKIDMITMKMNKMNLPSQLVTRVQQYYSYLWNEHGTFDLRNKFGSDLSPSLTSEIDIFVHQDLIRNVGFLQACSSSIIQLVVQRLEPQTFLAGDFILHKHSPFLAMYIIERGQCSMLSPALETNSRIQGSLTCVKKLRKHDLFGESCMLFDEQQKSEHHILADTEIDAQMLTRPAFDAINREHPELLIAMLRTIGREEQQRLEDISIREGPNGREDPSTNFTSVRMQLAVHTEFPADLIEAIVEKVELEMYDAGQTVLEMRQSPVGLFFIREGQLQVSVPSLKNPTARSRKKSAALRAMSEDNVRLLAPGHFFGELSLLHRRPVSANVRALSTCALYVLRKQEFELLKVAFPSLPLLLEQAVEARRYEQVSPFMEPPRFLDGLSADMTKRIVQKLTLRSLAAGEVLITQTEPLDALSFVVQGELEAIELPEQPEWRAEVREEELSPSPPRHGANTPNLRRQSAGARRSSCLSRSGNALELSHARGSFRCLVAGGGILGRRASASSEETRRPRAMNDSPLLSALRRRGSSDMRPPATRERRVRTSIDVAIDREHGHHSNKGETVHDVPAEVLLPLEERRELILERLDSHGTVVTYLEEGDVFGEQGLLDADSSARATLVAREPTQVYQLSRDDFMSISATLGNELRQRLISHSRDSKYDICEFLATKSLLMQGAPVQLINAACRKIKIVTHAPEDTIVTAGSPSQGVFFVVDGECNCLVKASDGNKTIVKVVKPGDCFGELSLVDPNAPKPTFTDVIAATNTRLFQLAPSDFTELTKSHLHLRQALSARVPAYDMFNFFFNLPLFNGITHEAMGRLMSMLETRSVMAGLVVQREDELCDQMCFLASGRIIASTKSPKTSVIKESGHYFGEEIIYGARTKTEVQTATDCTLYVLNAEQVEEIVALFPSIVTMAKGGDQLQRLELDTAEVHSAANGTDSTEWKCDSTALVDQRLALVQLSLSQMARELNGKVDSIASRVEQLEDGLVQKLDALLAKVHMDVNGRGVSSVQRSYKDL
ncbi:hypothetical protein AB1Y20_005947 [Prymnesium parvum]|uniref:Cyclic nucleotide-binding domain-containing protein n=1 Tax=Prymnesium parvum TaxID=97485 RepID=A0AB34J106_PRYPA